jgi:hypothetical protein
MDNRLKISIALGLCLGLGTGFISLRAMDTPAQAAARAALIQKLNQPDDLQTRSLTATNTPSVAMVGQPAKFAPGATETIPGKTMAPQTAATTPTPEAASVAAVPVPDAPVISPAAEAPAAGRSVIAPPAAIAPALSPVTLLLVLIALLLIALAVMLILLLKLRALKLMLLKQPAVMARLAAAPRKHGARRSSTAV